MVGSVSNRRSCQPVNSAHTRPPLTSCMSAVSVVSVTSVIRIVQVSRSPGLGSGPWKRMRSIPTGKTVVRSVSVPMIQ